MKNSKTAKRQDLPLQRDAFGRLFLASEGQAGRALTPVRSFPISATGEGIALVDAEGAEQAWIESLDDLPDDVRALLQEELASREFMPRIQSIRQVSSFATPSTWQAETDRCDTSLLLRAEEDIRRLTATTLLIIDRHGIQFLISNLRELDEGSRRLLDHFL